VGAILWAMRRSLVAGGITGIVTVLLSQQFGFLIALGVVCAAALVVRAGLSLTAAGRHRRQGS
jgi:hypothetical protein